MKIALLLLVFSITILCKENMVSIKFKLELEFYA